MRTLRSVTVFLALSLLFAPLALPPAGRAQEQGAAPPAVVPAQEWVELHRLRVVNRQDGAVQVSTDGGRTWALLGRVTIPATTVAEGFLASNYADPGTVAAAAIHGLRIRTGEEDKTLHAPRILSINPREYAGKVNKGFGGYVAGLAGIFTDIPAGASLFRNLAPFVGNPVFLQTSSGSLMPLPTAFRPAAKGEVLVIVVQRPSNALVEVVFENRAGGAVTARYADGTKRRLTSVVKPVLGVGRFDGTAYTGVGRINTAHTGVITVSTAPVDASLPEGEGRERRGGFQISPAWHNARVEEAGAPVVMTVGEPGERKRDLEGTPPLYRDMISLAWEDGGDLATTSALVDVAIDGGDWEPMPAVVGAKLDAFTGKGLSRHWKAQGKSRTTAQGVTSFRLRLPFLTPARSRKVAEAAATAYGASRLAAAKGGKIPLVAGVLTVNANPTNAEGISFVRLVVEGIVKGFTNRAPFTLTWDTSRVPNGEYLVEAEALDRNGSVLTTTYRRIYVHNTPSKPRAEAAGD